MVFWNALMAAVFTALYSVNDNLIMHNVILCPEDKFTAVSFYLMMGGWIGVICNYGYSVFLGKKIDKEYAGFNVGNFKMQIFAFTAGILSASSTVFYLVGSQNLDPSLVLCLANISILYLVIYDVLLKYIKIQEVILPALIVIAGSALSSITRLSGGMQITLLGITVLLLGRYLTMSCQQIIKQRGVRASDAVIFHFWRFVWLSFSGTCLMLIIAFSRDKLDLLIAMRKLVFPTLPWILVTMFFVFFSSVLENKAIKTGAVSKVALILNSQIVMGIPLTLMGDVFKPGVFGEIPREPFVWLIRLIGVLLIILGITFLAKKRKEASHN